MSSWNGYSLAHGAGLAYGGDGLRWERRVARLYDRTYAGEHHSLAYF